MIVSSFFWGFWTVFQRFFHRQIPVFPVNFLSLWWVHVKVAGKMGIAHEYCRNRTRMTRIWRISADYVGFNRDIREDPLNPRYPRSISSNLTLSNYESVEIRSIRPIRVLFLRLLHALSNLKPKNWAVV